MAPSTNCTTHPYKKPVVLGRPSIQYLPRNWNTVVCTSSTVEKKFFHRASSKSKHFEYTLTYAQTRQKHRQTPSNITPHVQLAYHNPLSSQPLAVGYPLLITFCHSTIQTCHAEMFACCCFCCFLLGNVLVIRLLNVP